MFKHLVTSLGAFKLIKDEDSGDTIVNGLDVSVPDLRIVLPDGRVWVVEVKNHHKRPDTPFAVPLAKVEEWERYAALFNQELRLAIYWSRVNTWTLVPLSALNHAGTKAQIAFADAFTANEMVFLGDLELAADYPLVWHVDVDVEHVRGPRGQDVLKVRVTDASIRCRGQVLHTRRERELAYQFMFFGRWESGGWGYVELAPDRGFMELVVAPPKEAQEHGDLAPVAALSGLFSAHYRDVTAGTRPKRLQRRFQPGMLGKLLSKDYDFQHGNLPLRVLQLLPRGFSGPVPDWL